MADQGGPAPTLQDYLTLTKLSHTLGGIYIWETVFTADFEVNILRGEQPYRWTIWIYLATRYTGLLAFIFSFIIDDRGRVPCQPVVVTGFALYYACWAFASLIIVFRIIAIWNRNTIVSSVAIGTWLVALGLNIRTVVMTETAFDPVLGSCVALNTHRGLVGAVAILTIDALLLVLMLVGLLRYTNSRRLGRRSTGIWYLLYTQSIMWLILAAIAEIPAVVFLSLNINDAWNQMFLAVAITILSICATRMYRSLSEHGSLTEYSSDPPRLPAGWPRSNHQRREAQGVHGVHITTHVTTTGTVTQSDQTMAEPPVFIPAEQKAPEFVPGASDTALEVPVETKLRGVAI